MKRVIGAVLCLVLLFSCVAVFSACTKYTGVPTVTGRKMEIDITEYQMTYNGSVSTETSQKIKDFAALIRQKTGATLKATAVDSDDKVYPGKQILVGSMDCSTTQKALEGIKGHGWVIRVIDDNIVIAGTTQLFTNMAIEYFTEHYIDALSDRTAVLEINKKVLLQKTPTVDIVSDGEYHYAFIYSQELDAEPGWQHVIPGNHSGGSSKDDIDYPVALAQEVLPAALKSAMDAKNFPDYWSDKKTVEKEVLVGITNRSEGAEAMKNLPANGYGLYVRGDKIVIGAWNDEALEFAYRLFMSAVEDSYYKNEEGAESIVFPAQYTDTYLMDSDWITDFPKPEGENVSLVGTLSSGDDSLIYAYRGAGVTGDAFDAYCRKLQENGYTLVQSHTLEQNKFATYKNTEENTTLHVEFASYVNAGSMPVTNNIAKTYVEDFAPTLRVTSSPLSSVTLPTAELLNENAIKSVTAITDSMITQVDVNYEKNDKGMFYIITLEDGTFIVVDGATNNNGLDNKLWSMLNGLYEKAHGYKATAEGSIHIRAWLLTHEHGDHYAVLYHFLRNYGRNSMLKMDYLLANFTSKTQDYNAMQPSHYIADRLQTLQSYHPFKYIKVHTGQRLYIKNVMLEVLYTHEDIAPARQYFFNDTSTVFKTTIYNTDGKGNVEDTETFMILGDAALITSTFLRATYSAATLDVDQVQVAHHGGFGCEYQLYQLMSPTVTWWALDAKTINNTCAPENRNHSLENYVGYHLMHVQEGHKYAYIADESAVTLTLSKNGPLYDKIQDANADLSLSTNILPYDDYTVIDVAKRRQ